MKRAFPVIVAVAFVIGGIYFATTKYNAKTIEAASDVSALKVKSDYLDRVAWIRVVPEEKAYKDEVTTFLRTYFKDVNTHLNTYGEKYAGRRDFDDYLVELEGRKGKGAEKLEEKKATYEYVKTNFDLLKGGSYSPVWTATSNGLRLDILSTNSVMSGGEEKIRYQIILWGAPRDERTDDKGSKKVTASARFNINWKMYDDKDRLLGEMTADGDPTSRIDWPERYIKYFPPGLLLGHYDVDLMPGEVPSPDPKEKGKPVAMKRVEITFHVVSRSPSGGDINGNFVWKLDVPAEWKLKSGQAWKGATDSIRPEEEIDPRKQAKR